MNDLDELSKMYIFSFIALCVGLIAFFLISLIYIWLSGNYPVDPVVLKDHVKSIKWW